MALILISCPNCGGYSQIAEGRSGSCPYCAFVIPASASVQRDAAAQNVQFAEDVQFAPPPVQQPVQVQKPDDYVMPRTVSPQYSTPKNQTELTPAKWIGLVLFCCAIGICAFVNSEVFLNTDWIVYPSVLILMVCMLFVPALLGVTAPKKVAGENPAFRFFLVIASYIVYFLIIFNGGWGIIHLIDSFF